MLEDRAGNLWVGVDDGLYLFIMGDSVASLTESPAAWHGDWVVSRILTGISGQNVQAIRESLSAYAISRFVKCFLRRRFRLHGCWLRIQTGHLDSDSERRPRAVPPGCSAEIPAEPEC